MAKDDRKANVRGDYMAASNQKEIIANLKKIKQLEDEIAAAIAAGVNQNSKQFTSLLKNKKALEETNDLKAQGHAAVLDEMKETEKLHDRSKRVFKSMVDRESVLKRSGRATRMQREGMDTQADAQKTILDIEKKVLGIRDLSTAKAFDSKSAYDDITDKTEELNRELKTQTEQLSKAAKSGDKTAEAAAKRKIAFTKLGLKELDNSKKLVDEAKLVTDEIKRQEEVTEKLRASSYDLVDTAEQQVLFAKEMVKQMLKNPIFLMAAAAMAVVKAFGFLNEKTKEFQEKVGGSVTQGRQLRNELAGAQIHAKALGYDAAEAAGALTEEFGSLKSVNSEVVMAMGRMEKGLGVSVATSAKLLASMTSLTGKSQASAVATMEFGASLAMANDVAPGAVMEDIAGNTEAFAAYGKDGGKNMIKAAVAARKLGLELGTMVKISDSLLDFETSIQNEMEASMLIGKQLNYNKARELALSGDLEGATKNVMDQIGGAAEFQKMNVMQRKALADSIGVSVEEMSALASGKVEMKQPDKTSEEQLKDSMDDSKLTMLNLITADNALKIAIGILTVAVGLNTLSQGKLGGMFKNFGKGGMFKNLLGKGKNLAKTTGTGAMSLAGKGKNLAVGAGKKVMDVAGKGKNLAMDAGKGIMNFLSKGKNLAVDAGKGLANVAGKGVTAVGKGSKALSTGIKTASKGVGKGLLKKIPGIGLVAGLGFAASRLMKGDALGALGEVASGAASIIPGIGTAVSTAIDVGMIARDASKAAKETAETAQDATRVQIAEKKNIIKTEKSANALRAEAIQAEKAAKDAIVIQKKEAEKQAKAKAVEAKQIKVEPVVPKPKSKEELEAELATKRALQAQQQQAALNASGGMEKRRTRQDLARTNTDINKLIAAIEAQTTAIKEGTEKQVKATKDMVND